MNNIECKTITQTSKTQKVYTLRMNSVIFDAVRNRADINKRSIAKEIEFIIEQYLKSSSTLKTE